MQKCADEKERENPLIIGDVFVVDKITLKLSSVIYNTTHHCMYVLFIKLHIVVSVVIFVVFGKNKSNFMNVDG